MQNNSNEICNVIESSQKQICFRGGVRLDSRGSFQFSSIWLKKGSGNQGNEMEKFFFAGNH